ncbi:MAG: hypothetical protein IJD76_00570 [Bacilli bacterium]|nr:hypothetical protein [Bacilli bacterium]
MIQFRTINFISDFKITLLLIAFGIYVVATIDLIQRIYPFDKIKYKRNYIYYYLIQIIYVLLQIIVTYYFTFNMAKGYVPIYFFVFVILGIVIYYMLLRKNYLIVVNKIIKVSFILIKKLLKILVCIMLPIDIIKLIIKYIKQLKTRVLKKKEKENS